LEEDARDLIIAKGKEHGFKPFGCSPAESYPAVTIFQLVLPLLIYHLYWSSRCMIFVLSGAVHRALVRDPTNPRSRRRLGASSTCIAHKQ